MQSLAQRFFPMKDKSKRVRAMGMKATVKGIWIKRVRVKVKG
jgi:hypothetical protein